ncbi:MAG: hypothetical protein HYX52_06325 [Chloroflexi bacterium]|nr:hypothetical protein [Chloroflexota bacterium]
MPNASGASTRSTLVDAAPIDANTTKPVVRHFLEADVKCYLCGSYVGSIESEQRSAARSVQFRRLGDDRSLPILSWRRLRCERCNGPVYLDETRVITRRYENLDWAEERPRRGRPPKHVVEERRRRLAEAAALETETSAPRAA